ncbi:MAG: 2'-5' RNA ligase family protein [Janthinobacterium lividum]
MKMLSQNQNTKINSQDYLLVIEPSEEVISEVKRFKAKALNLIGPFRSFKSKAHITVNHYDDNASCFDDRTSVYRKMVNRINSFHINICGFDYFEHQNTYTIYAKVELNPDIEEAFFKLRKIFGTDVRNTPHVTIARSLSFAQYKVLWDYFKNLKFECSFYTEEIVVLTSPAIVAYNAAMEIKTEFKFKSAV